MTTTLTTDQIKLLHADPKSPLRLVDPVSQRSYVLVSADQYDRVFRLLSDEEQVTDAYAAIDRAFAEGWDEPKMNDYDHYEENRR